MIDQQAIDDLVQLIGRMNGTPLLSDAQKGALLSARRFDFFADYTKAEVIAHQRKYSPTALAFFQGPDPQGFLKSIRNDLSAQVKITNELFSDWLRLAEYPAPAYANRIGIILRKAKRRDLDQAFSEAYCRHFPR